MNGLSEQTLRVAFATTPEEIAETQKLRYEVFARELGATIGNEAQGYDQDRFDPFCQHIIVRETGGQIVACSRILTTERATGCGGFYSQTEFDLTPILALPGRIMEVGRTCVHAHYRQGPAIALLLYGLARFMEDHAYDYLIGCGSIPLSPDRDQALRTIAALIRRHGCPQPWRVQPHHPLPLVPGEGDDSAAPALLRAYMRLGGYIGGAPCFDPAFNVADVFILMLRSRFNYRYLERLLERALKQQVA